MGEFGKDLLDVLAKRLSNENSNAEWPQPDTQHAEDDTGTLPPEVLNGDGNNGNGNGSGNNGNGDNNGNGNGDGNGNGNGDGTGNNGNGGDNSGGNNNNDDKKEEKKKHNVPMLHAGNDPIGLVDGARLEVDELILKYNAGELDADGVIDSLRKFTYSDKLKQSIADYL